jgi:hypothetical protein
MLELKVELNLLGEVKYIKDTIGREFELSNNKRFKSVGYFFY